ncbi:MAG TPA: hypothetical protein VF740_13600 [Candidatus Acidoferrum sp.]
MGHSNLMAYGPGIAREWFGHGVLVVMQMAGRAAFLARGVAMLEEKERAGAVGGENVAGGSC